MKTKATLLHGSILTGICGFAIPLFAGNLLQQLYNAVDSYIAGNLIGSSALAAVGVSSPIINLVIGFFVGIATGASVIVAQSFGAGDEKRIKTTIHTSIVLTIVSSVICTVIGVAGAEKILLLIHTPSDILDDACAYLQIFFAGVTFTIIYNMVSGILRALGDARRPLYFLIVSSLLHLLLDYIFVRVIPLGIQGPALSTLLSQAVSALLSVGALKRHYPQYQISLLKPKMENGSLIQILRVALPTGLQQSVGAFTNVLTQTFVNSFGTIVVAGYSAAIKIDSFVILPLLTLNMAVTTFVGQNLGAGNYVRVRQGIRKTLLLSVMIILTECAVLAILGRELLGLFNPETEIIEAGRLVQYVFIPFYIVLPFVQILSGALRGAGISSVPMCIILLNFLGFRQVCLWIANSLYHRPAGIYFSQPITWLSCAGMMVLAYIRYKKQVEGA